MFDFSGPKRVWQMGGGKHLGGPIFSRRNASLPEIYIYAFSPERNDPRKGLNPRSPQQMK